MSHSYVSSLYHCVFSTSQRRPLIADLIQPKLWAYMGGIARTNGIKALAVGGVSDHAHLLLSLPGTIAIAKAMQLIKAGASKWLRESRPDMRSFTWQEGYAAFSIGISQLQTTIRYIENQTHHHRRKSFEDEFRSFLDRHDLQYDPRYMFG